MGRSLQGRRGMGMFAAPGKVIAGYDLDSGLVLIPTHVWHMSGRDRMRWFKEHKIKPVSGGPGAYSMFEMYQPFQVTDATTQTAAAEAVLTNDTILALPPNVFAFPGRALWFRAMGKISVAATPGTWTFRLKWTTPGGGTGGTTLVASGAITPNAAAVTDNMWYLELWLKALTTGQTATALRLLAYGEVFLANTSGAAGELRNQSMPPGGTAVGTGTGDTASLDGTVQKAPTLTIQPSLATGSITCRDAWVVAMN